MCSQVQIPHANHPPRQTVIVILVPRRSRRPTRRSRHQPVVPATNPSFPPSFPHPARHSRHQPVVPASFPHPARHSRLQPVIPASFPPPTRRSRRPTRRSRHQPVIPANPSFPPPTRHSRHQPVIPAQAGIQEFYACTTNAPPRPRSLEVLSNIGKSKDHRPIEAAIGLSAPPPPSSRPCSGSPAWPDPGCPVACPPRTPCGTARVLSGWAALRRRNR